MNDKLHNVKKITKKVPPNSWVECSDSEPSVFGHYMATYDYKKEFPVEFVCDHWLNNGETARPLAWRNI